MRVRELTADLLNDPQRWEGHARTPVQLLMQYDDEIADVEYGHPEGYGDERYPEQTMAFGDGGAAACMFALKHTAQELRDAIDHHNYVSWGDDTRDYYESGWNAVARWAAGEFDWDVEGYAVYPGTSERLK